MAKIWVKNTIVLSQWLKCFLYLFKNKIILNFGKFVATKKIRQLNFSPSSFVTVVRLGSGMDKNKDTG
jgi:hypothetical protein